MTISWMVDQLVTSMDVSLLDTVTERLIFNGCPLNWHPHFIFAAAITKPTQEGQAGEVNKDDCQNEGSLSKHDQVSKDAVN